MRNEHTSGRSRRLAKISDERDGKTTTSSCRRWPLDVEHCLHHDSDELFIKQYLSVDIFINPITGCALRLHKK